ncbi:hypothetical protein [Streptomyces sp. NPDC093109]|uniref:hypothetical protein n=1 Tax=Streptomyces sp. NPDC093109 TaxID=3154977 RepID=UPI0034505500
MSARASARVSAHIAASSRLGSLSSPAPGRREHCRALLDDMVIAHLTAEQG